MVDDHDAARRGIRSVLTGDPSLDVVGEAVDGTEAIQKSQDLRPDIILLDITLPATSGLQAAEHIRGVSPDSRIILARERAEAKFRGLLLQLQDEERRRLARELHDSAGQLLAALNMILTPLESEAGRTTANVETTIKESLTLVDQLSRELRTISYLLHPPLLDEAGLSSALRQYLEGFMERSKIEVRFECPEDFGRLHQDLETAVFRVVQECLTNIHRHSGSPVAGVRLSRSDHEVRLEVADQGKGIPPEKRKAMDSGGMAGVGIRGMRERIRQLGGSLEINSDTRGTITSVWLPIPDAPSAAA